MWEKGDAKLCIEHDSNFYTHSKEKNQRVVHLSILII